MLNSRTVQKRSYLTSESERIRCCDDSATRSPDSLRNFRSRVGQDGDAGGIVECRRVVEAGVVVPIEVIQPVYRAITQLHLPTGAELEHHITGLHRA